MTSSNRNYLPKALLLNAIILGIRVSTYEFGRDTHAHSVHDKGLCSDIIDINKRKAITL